MTIFMGKNLASLLTNSMQEEKGQKGKDKGRKVCFIKKSTG
jgi:hypothetical protein